MDDDTDDDDAMPARLAARGDGKADGKAPVIDSAPLTRITQAEKHRIGKRQLQAEERRCAGQGVQS